MNFFANQDAARQRTKWLIALFVIAVVAIVAICDITVILFLRGLDDSTPRKAVIPDSPRDALQFFAVLSCLPLTVIVIGSLCEIIGVSGGGAAVARDLGARPISTSTRDAAERRLLNVVEEMAIASGTAVPQVFVMDGESGINAFAAGFSPNEAAITVTRAALDTLNRDELQGVIGHEFSHILNGDMRLNLNLMGVLGGLLAISIVGSKIADIGSGSKGSKDGSLAMVMFGMALVGIGYIGVFFGRLIKSGVSRQREFLADASSVQFTRNPDGIGRALARIAQSTNGALIKHPHAEKASHMFFGEALEVKMADLMATHPPVADRLQKIYGRRIMPSDIVARATPTAQSTAMPQSDAASSFIGASEWGINTAAQRAPDAALKTELETNAATVASAVGTVSIRQMDYAVSLLDALPQEIREQSRTIEGAKLAMYGLVLALGGPVKAAQEKMLGAAGVDANAAFAMATKVQALEKTTRLPLITLAIPALKSLPEPERLQFLALLQQLIEADRRITLEEFVLSNLLSAALGARAGRAVPVTYRAIDQLAEDARLVLSLVAHATRSDSVNAFARGLKELGIAASLTLIEARSLNIATVTQSLARLNKLAPLQKPRLVKACVQAALVEGKLSLTEAELLRAVCATIDCPLPPFVETMKYAA